jgi:DNA end-binding protein Ku
MATRPKKAGPPLPRGSKLTIALPGNPFPIEIGVKAATLVKTGTGRLTGKTVCTEHLKPVYTKTYCTVDDEECETTSGYDVGDGRYVEVDKSALGADKSDRLELKALVEPGAVDPLYFERPFALFAAEEQEQSFVLLASALRESGRWAIGTAVMNSTPKAVVLRWSQEANCLLMHQCTFDARVEWGAVDQIIAASNETPQLEGAAAVEAAELIGNLLGDEFDFDTVVDEYAHDLIEAVRLAEAGLEPLPKEKVVEAAPVADLMEALRGSVVQAKKSVAKKPPAPKPAAPKKSRAKVAA